MTNSSLPIDRERFAAAAASFGLRLAVLFGSRARGQARPGSDVDVAVAGCAPTRFWALSSALQDALTGGAVLDLVRLEQADALFRQEIMHDAVLLYGDPDLFCEYRAFAFRDFVDSADLFALEYTLLRRKLALIAEGLKRLAAFRDVLLESLRADEIRLAAVERMLERIVMRAIDVNEHLIAALATGQSRIGRLTYRDTILMLADFVDRVAPAPGA